MGVESPFRRRRQRTITVLLAALASLFAAGAGAAAVPGVAGRVVHGSTPVPNAAVYAYQVVERTFRKASTDLTGEFLFEQLPAGLYKIVAHKIGVPPAVLVLARRAADDAQYVQVELAAEVGEAEADYWSLRSDIPADVLRELAPSAISLATLTPEAPVRPSFRGGVTARAGVEDLGIAHLAEVAGAQVDINGQLGGLLVEFEGEFQNLAANSRSGSALLPGGVSAQATSFRVDLSSSAAGRIGIVGQQHERLVGTESAFSPLDFSNFQLRYVNDFGSDRRSTDLSAQYLNEQGLNSGSGFAPESLPQASRLLTIQGSYAQLLGERGKIRAGMRYRAAERTTSIFPAAVEIDRYLDLWSNGEVEVDSAVVLEYGLFTTLRDGSLSLVPRGGFVLRLTPEWQASLSASRRVVATADDPLEGDFTPLLFQGVLACDSADSECYEAQVVHGDGEQNSFRLRSSFREFDRTVRLFLRDDFYAGSEGIFFVPGDSLPEFQATLRRRFGPAVVASWNSSYATGGGGMFQAADRKHYENEVVYLSVSLDTTIEPTATGIFLAFQRIDQRLTPLAPNGTPALAGVPASAGLQRLELALSQDLSALFDLTTNWAVRVGMELVRGDTLLEPVANPDELRRRLTTSVAVRF